MKPSYIVAAAILLFVVAAIFILITAYIFPPEADITVRNETSGETTITKKGQDIILPIFGGTITVNPMFIAIALMFIILVAVILYVILKIK